MPDQEKPEFELPSEIVQVERQPILDRNMQVYGYELLYRADDRWDTVLPYCSIVKVDLPGLSLEEYVPQILGTTHLQTKQMLLLKMATRINNPECSIEELAALVAQNTKPSFKILRFINELLPQDRLNSIYVNAPTGNVTSFDWFSSLLAIGALLALVRYKSGTIPVILGCGLLGLPWRLV